MNRSHTTMLFIARHTQQNGNNDMIIQGDALVELKKLSSESVDCCVTSPPYWALRDYGTATWEGGNSNCNHIRDNKISDSCTTGHKEMKYIGVGDAIFKDICGKCGAKRIDKQLGLESTPEEYINKLCDIFDEVRRVLKPEGSCWVNMGDTYASTPAGNKIHWKQDGGDGVYERLFNRNTNNSTSEVTPKPKQYGSIKMKSLCQIPARFSIEMCNRGWVLRNRCIWWKPNCMPSSVKDRFTVDYEDLFLFTRMSKGYYFETQYEPLAQATTDRLKSGKWKSRIDSKINQGILPMTADSFNRAIETMEKTGKRIKRCVWRICPKGFKEAHFAVFPEELVETPIKASCPEYICNKCGKARKIVYEPINKITQQEREEYKATKPKLGETFREHNTSIKDDLIMQYKESGYTDCGCNAGWHSGTVLDPFSGAATTGVVAKKQGKNYIGIELNPDYIKISEARIAAAVKEKE